MNLADHIAAISPGQPTSHFDKLLGIKLVDVNENQAIVSFKATPDHTNPTGAVHGGLQASAMDGAMGALACRLTSAGQTVTNIDLNCRFLRPCRQGLATATARVVKRGRTILQLEARLEQDNVLVATASSAFMFIDQ